MEAAVNTFNSTGSSISGRNPATATYPGSSPRASETRFHRKKGDVVGRSTIRAAGSGITKYQPQMPQANTKLQELIR
jgi:hypothetical protein